MAFQIYNKEGQRTLPSLELNPKLNDPAYYMPSDALVDAVNVALSLGQPLLLTGEPGTGKTQLAHHIAWFFQMGNALVFNAQTTSASTDLFYKYDALGHFQYNQNNDKTLSPDEIESQFIEYQALGQAILSKQRRVVLIDEVDKAPRDLPNDILYAIEHLTFRVPEIKKVYQTQSDNRPIIVLTSNSEKNLPDAFLRRVVYFHIPFPDTTTLLKILNSKIEGLPSAALESIIAHFDQLRNNRNLKLKKPPATAELIYWTMLLQKIGFDPSLLQNTVSLSKGDKEKLQTSYSVLAKNKDDLESLINILR